jgi:hypothetical protein
MIAAASILTASSQLSVKRKLLFNLIPQIADFELMQATIHN